MNEDTSTPPRQSWVARHAGALFVGGLGLVFALVGLIMLFVAVPATMARSTELGALAVVSPATAPDHPDGVRVLVEARIASDAPERLRDFVAFRRREFRGWKEDGGRRREQWDTLEVVTPPLAFGEPPHRMSIVASDYELEGEPHTWRSSESLVHSLFGESTQEVVGFRRGDAVTADGVLERGPQGRGIRITVLAGGSAEAYRERRRESVQVLTIVGRIFSGVGATLLVAAVFTMRRRAA